MTKLDSAQSVALLSSAANKVVVAGPGSGKTRTLVALVARECTRYSAAQVAVLTFTNAAADEIKERLARDSNMDARLGFCGTLHSFLFLLLRSYPEHSGLPGSLALVEPGTADELLETVRAEMGVKVSGKRLQEAAREEYAKWLTSQSQPHFPEPESLDTREAIAAKEFYRRLITSGLLTFDTLLVFGLRLVIALTKAGKWPYRAVLWDEGQDGSGVDFDVLESCGAERKVIVADVDQSIYGFRGAEPARLVALTQPGSQWETITFETNYRSCQAVCRAANRLIGHNLDRLPKSTVPHRQEEGMSEAIPCHSQGGEIAVVTARIREFMEAGSSCSDIAILARTRRRAATFSEALMASGMPVRKRPEEAPAPADWKVAKLLLTAAAAPWSDFAVYGYVAMREGKQEADMLLRKAQLDGKPLKDLYLGSEDMWPESGDARLTPSDVADILTRHSLSRESVEKARGIAESLGGRRDPRNLAASLSEPPEKPDDGDMAGVTICTAHAAKGREFKHVFVVGMEEGTFPARKSMDSIEEERRLFFVALTRARDTVTCTWCRELPSYRGPTLQHGPAEPMEPSRFLFESGLIT